MITKDLTIAIFLSNIHALGKIETLTKALRIRLPDSEILVVKNFKEDSLEDINNAILLSSNEPYTEFNGICLALGSSTRLYTLFLDSNIDYNVDNLYAMIKDLADLDFHVVPLTDRKIYNDRIFNTIINNDVLMSGLKVLTDCDLRYFANLILDYLVYKSSDLVLIPEKYENIINNIYIDSNLDLLEISISILNYLSFLEKTNFEKNEKTLLRIELYNAICKIYKNLIGV